METNIDNRHHWFEIQNRIVERGEIYRQFMALFLYQPATTECTFDCDEFERLCYELNIHRLYGFGGCNYGVWAEFYVRNIDFFNQFFKTADQATLDQIDYLIEDLYQGATTREIALSTITQDQYFYDMVEIIVGGVLEEIGDLLDLIVPEI